MENKILVEEAKKYLNIRESKINNISPEIQEIQKSTWLAPGGWPWCAALTCQTLKDALANPQYLKYIQSRYYGAENAENWRCKDASAFGWIKWALKLKPKHSEQIVFDERSLMKAGDFIVFDFSHIGIGKLDQEANRIIATIEGNTQPKTAVRDGFGDGVYEMFRSNTLVKNYIRL